ncbi:tetraacyldisaccharide 4'-kinase [Pasteurella sp. PK-2025]|uniref:tetraacyldisaccharide 4'-kinase n=1 Tax=Pasteurella sp. PK-2025 TaxID=3413133 RepID=UPI003C717BE3
MQFWYSRSWLTWLLSPLALLFWLITRIRKALFQQGILSSYRPPVPVIVVGNLSVGGNGKTPVVIWLVQQLQQQGIQVGVISRGYGSQSKVYPLSVKPDSDPVLAGDEPVLIAKRTGVPVVISPNRQEAIELLLQQQPCDVIVSDDGLQHYALQRDVEIVVMDATRGLGNGFVLPAGPLRELPSRLKSVDLVISHGAENPKADAVMLLIPRYACHLKTGEQRPLTDFQPMPVSAIAGIGNPQRFFRMLQELGIQVAEHQAFQDHQHFSAEQLEKFGHQRPLLMTEKDAVKCMAFAQENWWFVPVEAQIHGEKVRSFLQKIFQQCIPK